MIFEQLFNFLICIFGVLRTSVFFILKESNDILRKIFNFVNPVARFYTNVETFFAMDLKINLIIMT
jgi:hypothetical protein